MWAHHILSTMAQYAGWVWYICQGSIEGVFHKIQRGLQSHSLRQQLCQLWQDKLVIRHHGLCVCVVNDAVIYIAILTPIFSKKKMIKKNEVLFIYIHLYCTTKSATYSVIKSKVQCDLVPVYDNWAGWDNGQLVQKMLKSACRPSDFGNPRRDTKSKWELEVQLGKLQTSPNQLFSPFIYRIELQKEIQLWRCSIWDDESHILDCRIR